MKPTNEERIEVARRLRELPTDMYEVEAMWKAEGLGTECHDQTDYYLIHDALFGVLPADHMHPCDCEELHSRLADLIEPEPERTCRAEDIYRDDDSSPWPCYVCSECGERLCYGQARDEGGKPVCRMMPYCAGCGAKVADK